MSNLSTLQNHLEGLLKTDCWDPHRALLISDKCPGWSRYCCFVKSEGRGSPHFENHWHRVINNITSHQGGQELSSTTTSTMATASPGHILCPFSISDGHRAWYTVAISCLLDWIECECCLMSVSTSTWKQFLRNFLTVLNFHRFLKVNFISSAFEVLDSDTYLIHHLVRADRIRIRSNLRLQCCKHAYFCTVFFWKYQKFPPKGHLHLTVSQGNSLVLVTWGIKTKSLTFLIWL